jgi:hypothetical protein
MRVQVVQGAVRPEGAKAGSRWGLRATEASAADELLLPAGLRAAGLSAAGLSAAGSKHAAESSLAALAVGASLAADSSGPGCTFVSGPSSASSPEMLDWLPWLPAAGFDGIHQAELLDHQVQGSPWCRGSKRQWRSKVKYDLPVLVPQARFHDHHVQVPFQDAGGPDEHREQPGPVLRSRGRGALPDAAPGAQGPRVSESTL